jgi:serine/threonine protein phosphatase PrpC
MSPETEHSAETQTLTLPTATLLTSLVTAPTARPRHPSWDAASARGPRTVNADSSAAHTDPGTGLTAFAVADGVGDSERAMRAARLSAEVAAATAARLGPEQGLLAAQRELLRVAPEADGGDSVLVVAVPGVGPQGTWCDVAWVGDSRAYLFNGRVLAQLTVDHTVAEYHRARRQPVTPRMEHLVTTSVRTLRPELIGRTSTGLSRGRLLLCSDGVHRMFDLAGLRAALDSPEPPAAVAAGLVAGAHARGGRDNATALVAEHPANR